MNYYSSVLNSSEITKKVIFFKKLSYFYNYLSSYF